MNRRNKSKRNQSQSLNAKARATGRKPVQPPWRPCEGGANIFKSTAGGFAVTWLELAHLLAYWSHIRAQTESIPRNEPRWDSTADVREYARRRVGEIEKALPNMDFVSELKAAFLEFESEIMDEVQKSST